MSIKLELIALCLLPWTVLVAGPREKLGFDPDAQIDDVASVYFAPENQILFRMRNPNGSYREFQRTFDRPNYLAGVHGWQAWLKGDRIVVRSGEKFDGKPVQYVFDRGRLVSFTYKGVKHTYAYDAPRPITAGGRPYAFGDASAEKADKKGKAARGKAAKATAPNRAEQLVEKEMLKKWAKSGRLRFPFNNPNENGFLYMTLALAAVFAFFSSRRLVRILGAGIFLAACGAMVMTASRGAFLSFFLALVPIVSLRFRTVLRSKAVWALAIVVLVGAVAWFATHESRLVTRGFTKQSRWSNQARLELWSAAPTMMAEAPNGWGRLHVGRSSMDWYQSLDELSLNGSLVNEHLTKLVQYGRLGRFGYLFGWLAVLGLLGFTAWRTRHGVGFGLCVAVLVAGWFNPVFDNRLLWIVPGVGIALFLTTKPWKVWRVRPLGVIVGAAVLAALVIQTGLMMWGRAHPAARGYPIHVEKNRVYVKGLNPQTWIVDDGAMLGGVLACKDIRGYYVYDRDAPSIGYVRRIKDLPHQKIHRLVLTGKTCESWLKRFGSRVEKEGTEAIKYLPDELVFISPPFPPSAVPEPYLQSCRTELIVGEFLACYEPEYADPPEWVKVVPAMELYLNGWMKYALGVR